MQSSLLAPKWGSPQLSQSSSTQAAGDISSESSSFHLYITYHVVRADIPLDLPQQPQKPYSHFSLLPPKPIGHQGKWEPCRNGSKSSLSAQKLFQRCFGSLPSASDKESSWFHNLLHLLDVGSMLARGWRFLFLNILWYSSRAVLNHSCWTRSGNDKHTLQVGKKAT